jgi:hypothetical protein
MIAAALERKVWSTSQGNVLYPNLFVALVGTPGNGKSLAIRRGRPIFHGLRGLRGSGSSQFKIMEGKATEAGTLEEMEILSNHDRIGPYSAMYVVNGEGSDSALKNHADDFRAMACLMYDCEPSYEKRLKTKFYQIPQPVMNILVGTTFDFLGTIVDQNSVMGGLASRLAYVIDEKELPEEPGLGEDALPDDIETRDKLIKDLYAISNLAGTFRYERNALSIYGNWWRAYRKERAALDSERVLSIMVRKPLLIQKLMMLYAVSESSELVIRENHMEAAISTAEYVTRNTTRVISEALMSNKDTQAGMNQLIFQSIKKHGGPMKLELLRRAISKSGADIARFDSTLKFLRESGELDIETSGSTTHVKLLVDPDTNF